MENVVQLIYVGNRCEIADFWNSEIPDWPVQDQEGRWYSRAFDGQRVTLTRNSIEFGFLARLMTEEEIEAIDISDLPGNMFLVDGKYYERKEGENEL